MQAPQAPLLLLLASTPQLLPPSPAWYWPLQASMVVVSLRPPPSLMHCRLLPQNPLTLHFAALPPLLALSLSPAQPPTLRLAAEPPLLAPSPHLLQCRPLLKPLAPLQLQRQPRALL